MRATVEIGDKASQLERNVTAVLTWIKGNPQAFKAYLVSLIALVAKLILALTGKTADLGQWSGFVDQAVDLLVGGLTIYGLIAGTVHVSRGSVLTSVDQASVIVAALAPAPVPLAVEQVKVIAQELEAVKTVTQSSMPDVPHRF